MLGGSKGFLCSIEQNDGCFDSCSGEISDPHPHTKNENFLGARVSRPQPKVNFLLKLLMSFLTFQSAFLCGNNSTGLVCHDVAALFVIVGN